MAEEDEAGGEAPKPPKIEAEDNPWYLLATLYGKGGFTDDELQAKNRATWNRYFAANLDEETRAKLIEEKRPTADELTPFSPEELQGIATAFAERSKESGKELALPANHVGINFSLVEFEQDAVFVGYLFSRPSFFESATFSGSAFFIGATFSSVASFRDAAFSSWAQFRRRSLLPPSPL
jgi:Pentapeptide repeats (9 copies)